MDPLLTALTVVLGILLGALAAWFLGRLREKAHVAEVRQELAERLAGAETTARTETERRSKAEAERDEATQRAADFEKQVAVAKERADQAQKLIAQQQEFVETSRKELETSFKALAAAALQGNNEQFVAFAEQKLGAVRTQAKADLDERKKAIETLLAPFKETLGKLETKTGEIEKARVDAYAKLEEQVGSLARSTNALNDKTTSLATALKTTRTKGRWGEIALRNIAELAGMTEHCDFEEQETQASGGRPDMTVRLPGERHIAVDAKVPLDAYLEAADAETDDVRKTALKRHVDALKGHVKTLASRDYAAGLTGDIDMVVLFVPGDPILAAAFEQDPNLQVDSLRAKVLLATPTTLVALLRTVAIYWQQRSMAENAQAIAETARELYERASKFGEELASVGSGLKTATEAYNRAVGSFEGRFLPMGRKLDEMKVTEQSKRELKAPCGVDTVVRELKE